MSSSRRRSPLGLLLLLPLLTGALALGVPGAAAAPNPPDDPAKGLHYQGLERAAAGPCQGRFETRAPAGHSGPARCSHGPDAAPEGVDVRVERAPETATETALRPEAVAAAAAAPLCTGDGVSGARVQLVYANIAGRTDRYATYASSFPVWAAAMDTVFDASAAETGGTRRIRFVHDASCAPTVGRVTLSTAAANDFQVTVDELGAQGFNRDDRKYVVWVDANVYCGMGQIYDDDKAGQNNANNLWGLVARIDNGCWGLVGQSVEAHELMHNLGGVQDTAPHSTPWNHCTDDGDRMCYTDGSGSTVTQVCPSSHENLFDCNHDDYYSTAPASGSYLATRWNAANSKWLTIPSSATVPSAPGGVSAVAGEGSATVTWTAPSSDGGKPVTSYVVTPFQGATAMPPQTFPATVTTQVVTGLADEVAHTFKVAAVNEVGTGSQSAASAAVTPQAGSRFNSLPPARLLDTRYGNGAPAAAIPTGSSIDLQVTGRGGVPASGVSAVVMNATVVDPQGGGWITAWPTGEVRPLASNLNFSTLQTVANLVVVKVGTGGKVSLYNAGGPAHLVADVAGWYGPSGAEQGSRYHALPPARVLDTRTGDGAPAAGMVAAGTTLELQVAGRGGVPATGVSAVILNLAVTQPVGGGYITAWPSGETRPLASNINFPPGATLANLVMVKVGANGKVGLYDAGAASHLVVDVAGWFGTSGETTGARYHPVTPARVLDTRFGVGSLLAPLLSAASLDVQATGRGGVPSTGVSAVVLNVTVVDPLLGGYLTAWPTGDIRPLASNLNFNTNQTVPNLVTAKLGAGGKVSIFNGGGTAHLVADVGGWYGAG